MRKREELTWKGHEGTFWEDGNVEYIDRGLGYKGVCICQNLELYTRKNECTVYTFKNKSKLECRFIAKSSGLFWKRNAIFWLETIGKGSISKTVFNCSYGKRGKCRRFKTMNNSV